MSRLPLFVYGTLLDPWVRRRVIGRAIKAWVRPACLRDAVALRIRDRLYPDAVPRPGGRAWGMVLTGLSAKALAHLDAYEGDEYDRIPIRVFTLSNRPLRAQIYRIRHYQAAHAAQITAHRWSLGSWRRRGGRLKVPACGDGSAASIYTPL